MLIVFFFDAKMPGVSISTFMLVALSLYIFLYYHFQYKGKERKLLQECKIRFAKVSSIWVYKINRRPREKLVFDSPKKRFFLFLKRKVALAS